MFEEPLSIIMDLVRESILNLLDPVYLCSDCGILIFDADGKPLVKYLEGPWRKKYICLNCFEEMREEIHRRPRKERIRPPINQRPI